jgi:hypothetical protein
MVAKIMANMVISWNANSSSRTSLHYRQRAARRGDDCLSELSSRPQAAREATEMERSDIPSSAVSADFGKEVASSEPLLPQRDSEIPAAEGGAALRSDSVKLATFLSRSWPRPSAPIGQPDSNAMNRLWIAILTILVGLEKVLPGRTYISRAAGLLRGLRGSGSFPCLSLRIDLSLVVRRASSRLQIRRGLS